ncbi:MAG: polysaccharide biosynthesis tyrosine autokinase [Cyanobacteria bacterium J06598_3]
MDKTSVITALTSALKRHYWAALATFVSVMGGSALYLLLTPPTYESVSRLMVDAKEVSVSDLGRALNDPESNSEVNPLATQAELITSEQVLRGALRKVFPDTPLDAEGIPSTSKIRKGLDVKIIPATNILELTLRYTDPALTAKILDATVESAAEDNVEVIRAKASTVREFLEASLPQQESRLKQAESQENLYRQENGIVSLPEQTQSLIGSLTQLENEERALVAQLQESEERVSLLAQVTGFEQLDIAYDAVRVGQDQELADLRNRFTALQATIAETSAVLGDQHPQLIDLLEQRDALSRLYVQKLPNQSFDPQSRLAGGRASNPLSQDLTAQYIAGTIENQALQERLVAVQGAIQQLRSRLGEIPGLQQPLATLARERQSAEASLQLLRDKLEEAKIAEAQLVNNIRVMGPAEIPLEKAAPSIPAVLLLAGVTGAILASGVILLLEAMDNTLRDAEEARRILQRPILGILPKLPPGTLISECPPEVPVLECLDGFLDHPMLIEPYHSLLQTLESTIDQSREPAPLVVPSTAMTGATGGAKTGAKTGANPGANPGEPGATPAKVIVVSSVFMGEGKSAVATHFGAVAAMLSRRTLIIDANFSGPIQNQFLGLPASPGLVDAIESDRSWLDVVQLTSLRNLSLLTHGQLFARPSALVEKPAMGNLLAEASALYDWIIIEASPVTLASEALTLSQHTDGLVLVVRPNFMPREKMRQVIGRIEQRGVPIRGIVLNETQIPWDDDNPYAATYAQGAPMMSLLPSGQTNRS